VSAAWELRGAVELLDAMAAETPADDEPTTAAG
jgi:hypothetical protein